MKITFEQIRKIIDDETIADSGVVLQTSSAARQIMTLISKDETINQAISDLQGLACYAVNDDEIVEMAMQVANLLGGFLSEASQQSVKSGKANAH